MVESSTHDYVQVLGQDLYDQCKTNFDLFATTQDNPDCISDKDSIEALLLSLGVDLEPQPAQLTFNELLEVMEK